ncbi:hypothetical protein Q0812_04355 [Brevundimonas sp. 2R-24]|uniref:Terminase small subunit n=1 Tax=Peiella sedimenti TaxID=3061083 RepID=A0ABT8SJA6_9CAUL|nr:hypothetical protein [Caulobacteraceae bacterium XZ-24]
MTDEHTPAQPFIGPIPTFAQRPHRSELWCRARQDYLAGDSAPVVAERYGLSERSLRRRASVQGWRRVDVQPPSEPDILPSAPAEDSVQGSDPDPEAEALKASPSRTGFRAYAFRRACEAAADDHLNEAAAWLKLQRLAEQVQLPPQDKPAADEAFAKLMIWLAKPRRSGGAI